MIDDWNTPRSRRLRDFHRWVEETEEVECFRWDDRGFIRTVEIVGPKREWSTVRDIFDGTESKALYSVLVSLNEMEVLAAA